MLGFVLDCEFLTGQAVRSQLAAMPNQVYLIRLIHSVRHRPSPGQRLWTAQELARDNVVRFLRAHIHNAAEECRNTNVKEDAAETGFQNGSGQIGGEKLYVPASAIRLGSGT